MEKIRLEHENDIRVENAECEERLRRKKEEREDRKSLETIEGEDRLLRQNRNGGKREGKNTEKWKKKKTE